jgi:hypothetical protein
MDRLAAVGIDLAKNVFVHPESHVSFCFTGAGMSCHPTAIQHPRLRPFVVVQHHCMLPVIPRRRATHTARRTVANVAAVPSVRSWAPRSSRSSRLANTTTERVPS